MLYIKKGGRFYMKLDIYKGFDKEFLLKIDKEPLVSLEISQLNITEWQGHSIR